MAVQTTIFLPAFLLISRAPTPGRVASGAIVASLSHVTGAKSRQQKDGT